MNCLYKGFPLLKAFIQNHILLLLLLLVIFFQAFHSNRPSLPSRPPHFKTPRPNNLVLVGKVLLLYISASVGICSNQASLQRIRGRSASCVSSIFWSLPRRGHPSNQNPFGEFRFRDIDQLACRLTKRQGQLSSPRHHLSAVLPFPTSIRNQTDDFSFNSQ